MNELEFDSETVGEDEEDYEGDEYEGEIEITPSPSLSMDYRVLWIRDRVMKFLGLSSMNHLFNDLITKDNHQVEEDLLNFLVLDTYGETDLSKKLAFFYKTYRSETIQEEVSVWEESHRKITAMAAFATKGRPQRLTKSAPGKVEKQEEDKIDKKKEKKPKKGKKVKGKKDPGDVSSSGVSAFTDSSMTLGKSFYSILEGGEADEEAEYLEQEDDEEGIESPITQFKKKSQTKSDPSLETVSFMPPPGDEDKYILTKKVVDKVVQLPVLHMFCGEIDGRRTDLRDVNLIYFMRTSEEGIPFYDSFEECCAEMPSYVVTGSLNGKFLSTLNRMVTYVFKPLIEKQFRGPGAAQRLHAQEMYSNLSGALHSEKTAAALQTIAASQASAFVRPSDYRRIALAANKLARKIAESEEQKSCDKISEKEETRADQQSEELMRSKKSKEISLSEKQTGSKKIESMSCKSHKSTPSTTAIRTEKKDEIPIEPVKKDMLDYLNKLSATIEWTLEHIEGDTLLTIPKISELMDPEITDEALCCNKKIVEQLEEVVMAWGKHIQKTLDAYAKKVPQGHGPMAEYDDWRDRETALSILVEQLKTSTVKRILSILNQSLSTIASAFDFFQIELWKYYTEARDNNKFLFTVLRYFKLINESDSFDAIADAIPSLMNGIRMMWVLSKYYCTEDKMVPLLGRISWQLCQNVTKNLAVKTLFKKPLQEVLQKTEAAHKMMRKWKATYLDTRRSIEVSGKGMRWEFDQRRLFNETEYISNVCKDLNAIASVLQDFYNIFGAELKSIINDPAQIDAIVKRVGKLITPIKEADFNIFSEFNRENWEATMNWFDTQVVFLENEAKVFIDECFMVLISAEEALYMLLKFRNMKTRAAIQDQLSRKFDVIMQQFSKEIGMVENIFNQGKRHPPLLAYHPPVAGAIFWERQLFHRLKNPVLLFQNVKELKNSDLKIFAFSQYKELAKHMKSFEESKFKAWVEKAQNLVVAVMKKNILTVVSGGELKVLQLCVKKKKSKIKDRSILTSTTSESLKRSDRLLSKFSLGTGDSVAASLRSIIGKKTPSFQEGKGSKEDSKQDSKTVSLPKGCKVSTISASTERRDNKKIMWSELMQGSILIERQLKFELNFNLAVFEIIREAELLEQLGFELPSVIRDVGIQKSRLHEDLELAEKMIKQYNDIVDKLDDADVKLLKTTLQNMEKFIQPGVTRLNWYSLGIKDYALSCRKLLKSLISIVGQVNQMKIDLDNRINFESYNLCSTNEDPNDPDFELRGCKAYYLEVEAKRTEVTCMMIKVYSSATPLLIKLESLVEETSSGKSQSMQLFYERYEYKIFTGLIKCFIRNLEYSNSQLSVNKPLFTVDAVLLASEVVLRPSPGEIFTIILHDIKDLMDRGKVFPRWKRGTCLECNPRMQVQMEDYVVFSYYEDIMNIQVINDLIRNIQDTAQKLSMNCLKYLQRWKKYGNLWFFDKKKMCEKFVSIHPTLQKYDEKFTFYGTILDEIKDLKDYFDILSVRINLKPLLREIKDHATEWKTILGNYLLEETLESMTDLKTKFDKYREEIELVISGLDRFKVIMQAITDVKKMSTQAEVQYLLYQETFRTLRMHEIRFSQEDEDMAYKLQQDWESLYLGALYRSTTLETTKDRFCDMTVEQIEDFGKEFLEFAEDFEKNGPGSVGDDLDRGITMMDEYGKRIEMLEEKRLDLVNAEILFDLEPSDYTPFLKVKKDYEGMEMLYKLYKQQKNARDVWSKTLWANLNPQQLMDGMDGFLKEFRKLPRTVRMLSVGQALDATMKSFRNSVPLFVELKNEAMRERHWQELMDKTGKHFDMSPDRSGEQ